MERLPVHHEPHVKAREPHAVALPVAVVAIAGPGVLGQHLDQCLSFVRGNRGRQGFGEVHRKADVIDDDPVFNKSSVDGSAFDIGLGLYYQRREWYAGVSVLHVTSPRVELGEKNQLDINATYYLTGGYNIQLRNPFLSIQTSALGRTDGVAWRGDISGRLQYSHEKRRFYAGLTYSPTTSVTVQVGGVIKGVRLGYSYEIYTSSMSVGNGSHELFVGYQMDIDFQKKGRNLHKSVRIL